MSFRQLKVWRALKRKPGSHNRDLRAALGWTDMSIAQALLRLEAKGCVRQSGKSVARRWWATNTKPVDERGNHPESQKAIRPYQHFATARLAKANYARGVWKKVIPPPKPATELERCWPTAVLVPIRQE